MLVLGVKYLVIVVIWRALATRVIGIQRSGCPTYRQHFATDATVGDVRLVHFQHAEQRAKLYAAGIRSTWRELAAKLKLNLGRPFLTSRLAFGGDPV